LDPIDSIDPGQINFPVTRSNKFPGYQVRKSQVSPRLLTSGQKRMSAVGGSNEGNCEPLMSTCLDLHFRSNPTDDFCLGVWNLAIVIARFGTPLSLGSSNGKTPKIAP